MELPSLSRDLDKTNTNSRNAIAMICGVAVAVVTIAIAAYGFSHNRSGPTLASDISRPMSTPSPMTAPDTPTPPVRKVY